MYNLDSILINKILGYLEPQKLVYNFSDTIISSYPHVSIIDIALVCKHWFDLISKMLNHLDIEMKIEEEPHPSTVYPIESSKIKMIETYTVNVFQYYNDRDSYGSRRYPYKSVNMHELLNAKHSLLNLNNIRSLIINNVYPWSKSFDQFINRIIKNGQLKSFTVVSEITLLENFIKKFKPTTFQYFVVPSITNYLDKRLVVKAIKYLTAPKNNITWLETIFENNDDMNVTDISHYLSSVEGAAPIAPIQASLSGMGEDSNLLHKHLQQISKLSFYRIGIVNLTAALKHTSPQLKQLTIKLDFCRRQDIKDFQQNANHLFQLLKTNQSIQYLKIYDWSFSKRSNTKKGSSVLAKHFSDILTVNTTLTSLSLNSFFHVNKKFFQSLESNTTLRSLAIRLFDSKAFGYLCHSASLNKNLYKLKMTNIYSPVVSSEISVSIGKLLQSDTHNIKIIKLNDCYDLDSKPIEDAINSVNSKINNTKKLYLIVSKKLGESLPKNSVNGEDAITINKSHY